MQIHSATHIGKIKKENQDRFLVEEKNGCVIIAVSDGMSGEARGERAAEMVISGFSAFNPTPDESIDLNNLILEINRDIRKEADSDPEKTYMGATCVAAIIRGDMAEFVHVGDSRLYILKDRILKRLTRDHRFVQDFIDSGEMSEQEAAEHPMAFVLDQSMGCPEIKPQAGRIDIEPGSKLLACSDGLTDELSDDRIRAILEYGKNAESLCDDLIRSALHSGGRDNITAVVYCR